VNEKYMTLKDRYRRKATVISDIDDSEEWDDENRSHNHGRPSTSEHKQST
jgi:hypothetical protein